MIMNPINMLKPCRKITGMSAILLPYTESGDVDWAGFESHTVRTSDAGLTPAINMDTGYINLLDDQTRKDVLAHAQTVLGDRPFVAGAFVGDQLGAGFNLDAYLR